jgi:DNA-binding transcriptional ArsR family regulator
MEEENGGHVREGRGSEWGASELLSSDRFYRCLAAAERRRLLAFLLVHRESTVEELATVLAGWHATESGTMATRDDHERVVSRLHHRHLPLLVDAGLVTRGREDGTVAIEALDPAVAELVELSIETERR